MREIEYLIWAVRNKETLEPYEKEAIITRIRWYFTERETSNTRFPVSRWR